MNLDLSKSILAVVNLKTVLSLTGGCLGRAGLGCNSHQCELELGVVPGPARLQHLLANAMVSWAMPERAAVPNQHTQDLSVRN